VGIRWSFVVLASVARPLLFLLFLLFTAFTAFPAAALAACLFTLRFRTRLTRGPKENRATPAATSSAALEAAENSAQASCFAALENCLSHFLFKGTLSL